MILILDSTTPLNPEGVADEIHRASQRGADALLAPVDVDVPLRALMAAAPTPSCPVMAIYPPHAKPEVVLSGITAWDASWSVVIHADPEVFAAWCAQACAIPAGTAGTNAPAATRFPRMVPKIEARHKSRHYQMSQERDLSGFTFYIPQTIALSGYEYIPVQPSIDAMTHEERQSRHDLRRWLSRFTAVASSHSISLMPLLHSLTAEERNGKGLDIEMLEYCRDQSAVRAIASGGLATVRHLIALARHLPDHPVAFPASLLDGTYTLGDAKQIVVQELGGENRAPLAKGVLGGGKLASGTGNYWVPAEIPVHQAPAQNPDPERLSDA